MTVTEKVAYLKGLMEGLEIDAVSKEGKIFAAILDAMQDLASSVEDLEEYASELTEQLDTVDEDLDALESFVYEDDDEDDDCDDGEDEFYDVTCPKCHEEFCVDENLLLDGSMDCPNCGEKLEFDIECDDDCDCGCKEEEK
ncbi:MAG: zinc-ribbon domain-containing protein [Oscillospiraceae bacterium]|nr:zinc-ribbon domain-containing protein [Oscillospiraceae bacterium]